MAPTRGIIYMTWGENAIRQAHQSMKSLWNFETNMPVMVMGDEIAKRYFSRMKGVLFEPINQDPFDLGKKFGFKFMAGRIKPLMAKLSPWDQTLYVDADSAFVSSPMPGFELLDLGWDMAIACHKKEVAAEQWANCNERQASAKIIGSPLVLYHNSGMIFWRKNERTDELFDLWYEEWMKYQHWDEQIALLRALFRSKVAYMNLPLSWNSNIRKEAFILHHWFGEGYARTELKRKKTISTTPHRRDPRPMVRVEIAPGRWVRCYKGDEEIVKERHKVTK
jgi:hypothetical protein